MKRDDPELASRLRVVERDLEPRRTRLVEEARSDASRSVLNSVTFRVLAAVAFVAASVATYAVYFVEPPRSDALIISWFVALVALHFLAGALVGWWALLLPVAIAVLLRFVYGEDSELPGESWADYLFASVVLFPVLVLGAATRWVVGTVVKRRRA